MPLGGGAVGVVGPAPGTLGWDFKLFEKITSSLPTSSSSPLATNHAGYDEASRFGVHLREAQNMSLDASTWARQMARREAVIRCTSPDARPRANSSLRAQRSTSSIGSLRAERSTSSIGSGRHLSATPSRVDLSSAGSSRNVFCHAFVGRHRNWCPPRRQPKT